MNKTFKFKLSILLLLLLAVFFLLWLRLLDVQLRQGQAFFRLAEQNRYFSKKEKAERAIFLDRYGQPLVENRKQYQLLLQPEQIYSDKLALNADAALALLATDSAQVSYDFTRVYPYKEALAHVLGYLSPVTAEDLAERSDLPLDELVGRMGLEKYFNTLLQSRAAYKKYEVNALGQQQRVVEYGQARYGQNLQTTLDPYLSLVLYRALAGQKGAAVVMDAENGEVLALVSSPSFDPNVFTSIYSARQPGNAAEDGSVAQNQQARQQLNSYFTDANQVFFDRVVSGTYPPGSIFKLVTATAALENQAIDQNTTVNDEGVLRVGDWAYANWYYTQYGRTEGSIDLVRAITRSNDIFFYKTAEWVGPQQLAHWARLFSFGQKPALPLEQVAAGLVPDPQWKARVLGEDWYLGNTYHFGIGQGDLLVTPLQVAQMTQALANQGELCQASLIKQERLNCQSLAIDEGHLELILRGMIGACSQGGTAYPLFAYNTDKETALLGEALTAREQIARGLVACKTGTAEFGAADARGYRKTHAWTTVMVGLDQAAILAAAPVAETEEVEEATGSAGIANLEATATAQLDLEQTAVADLDNSQLRQLWLTQVQQAQNLPREVVITVLIESDEEKPYKEGSDDAVPVVATLLNWLMGKE